MSIAAKKKIIFSSYDDANNPYYGGGGAVAIHHVASRISDFDVTVITGNYPGAKALVLDGVRYKRIGPSYFGPKLSQLLFHFLLPFYVRRESFDVWIESFTPPFSTSFLPLYTKKPVIGLVHMLAAEDMVRKYQLPFDRIENKGLKVYRHFIALTDVSRAKIKAINPSAKIALIADGVTIDTSRSKSVTDRNYILYMGRLEMNQKGLDLLLDAYASICGKIEANLVIAGGGLKRDEQALKEKIRKLGLDTRVTVTGRVQGQRKEDLFAECSLLVIPSRLETFGIVALEAMAYGKPIVAFDIKGLEWLPQGCALKAKAFDTLQFGKVIHRVLTDKKMRGAMSLAARTAVVNYSWDEIAKQYRTAIYEALKQ